MKTVHRLPQFGSGGSALSDVARPLDRAQRPIYAVWELTLACDLSCKHCGSRAGKARANELSPAGALSLVEQIADLGVKSITLIGGEVYLRRDWLQIVAALRARGLAVTVTTGGRGFTRTLAEAAREAGVQAVSVSLDGLGDTHNGLRGHASFERGLAALWAVRDAGLPVAINSQLNRRNQQELEPLYELLVQNGAYAWQISLTVAMGRAADHPETLLQPYDLDGLFPRLAAIAQRGQEAGIRVSRGNNVGYFGPLEEQFHFDSTHDYSAGCPAGRLVLGIESDGTIKGCPSLPTRTAAAGSVQEASLQSIWEQAPALQRLRDEPQLWGYCARCYYAKECGGGCTWTAEASLGRPGNNPYCHHRVLSLKDEGKRERLVQLERAPGEPFDCARFELVEEAWDAPESAVHATPASRLTS